MSDTWKVKMKCIVIIVATVLSKGETERIYAMSDSLEDYRKDTMICNIRDINVVSKDNGKKFTKVSRLRAINKELKRADKYTLLKDLPLAKIYCHEHLDRSLSISVISCHIDSVQKKYYTEVVGTDIHGTFDNSACTALLVTMMVWDKLNPQTIVVFTGNEENGFAGARQASNFIKKTSWIYQNLRFVMSLDLTNDFYGKKDFTIENLKDAPHRGTITAEWLKKKLKEVSPKAGFVEDACPDDSWEYAKRKLTCFSFCLPCKNLAETMHDEKGVSIKIYSLLKYSHELCQILWLTNAI
jgi:preprotein translocase subunit SecG